MTNSDIQGRVGSKICHHNDPKPDVIDEQDSREEETKPEMAEPTAEDATDDFLDGPIPKTLDDIFQKLISDCRMNCYDLMNPEPTIEFNSYLTGL